jgi:hypothetical protein
MQEDPDTIINEIRSIQQELVVLQQQVIQGQIKPDEYKRMEEERVKKIHVLEEKMANLTGTHVPDRDTTL